MKRFTADMNSTITTKTHFDAFVRLTQWQADGDWTTIVVIGTDPERATQPSNLFYGRRLDDHTNLNDGETVLAFVRPYENVELTDAGKEIK